MINPDLKKARKWAKEVGEEYFTYITDDSRAAIKVIQSLPDHIIDAEKLREALDGWDIAGKALRETDLGKRLEALITPSLPTFADMTPEEREACQWMQCEIDGRLAGILAREDGQRGYLWGDSGHTFGWKLENITPLPDLPKLVWPSLVVSGESETVSVETEDVTEESDPAPTPRNLVTPPAETSNTPSSGVTK